MSENNGNDRKLYSIGLRMINSIFFQFQNFLFFSLNYKNPKEKKRQVNYLFLYSKTSYTRKKTGFVEQ
jgi:hypothetical protein